jgi:tetratricopeptide (TPR) repeat protein
MVPAVPASGKATLALPRFDNPASTRILVASFPPLAGVDPADGLLEMAGAQLHLIETIVDPTPGAAARRLEIKRVFTFIDSHEAAHALLLRAGADVLVWGDATCQSDVATDKLSPAVVCAHVTVDPAPQDRGTPTDKHLDLDWLTDFDLPPLALSSRLGLASFLVGVHLQGDARYAPAGGALGLAASLFTAEGREHALVDAYDAQLALRIDSTSLARAIAESGLRRVGGKGGIIESELNLTLGEACQSDDDAAGALRYYRQSLLVAEKALPAGHPHLADIEMHLGRALNQTHDFAGALVHYQRARAFNEAFLGVDHLRLAVDWKNIGVQLVLLRDPGATAALEHAKAIVRARQGTESMGVAWVEMSEGVAYAATGDDARAMEHDSAALAILEKQPRVEDAAILDVLGSLGSAQSNLGRHDEAIVTLRRALAISVRINSAGSVGLASSEQALADELLKGPDHEEATAHYLRALTIYQTAVPAMDPRIDKVRTHLAIAIAARSGRKPSEKTEGAVLVDCSSQSCSESGLKLGDWLTSIDAMKVKSAEHLREIVAGRPRGRKMTFTLLRAGKKVALQVPGPEKLEVRWTDQVLPKP